MHTSEAIRYFAPETLKRLGVTDPDNATITYSFMGGDGEIIDGDESRTGLIVTMQNLVAYRFATNARHHIQHA